MSAQQTDQTVSRTVEQWTRDPDCLGGMILDAQGKVLWNQIKTPRPSFDASALAAWVQHAERGLKLYYPAAGTLLMHFGGHAVRIQRPEGYIILSLHQTGLKSGPAQGPTILPPVEPPATRPRLRGQTPQRKSSWLIPGIALSTLGLGLAIWWAAGHASPQPLAPVKPVAATATGVTTEVAPAAPMARLQPGNRQLLIQQIEATRSLPGIPAELLAEARAHIAAHVAPPPGAPAPADAATESLTQRLGAALEQAALAEWQRLEGTLGPKQPRNYLAERWAQLDAEGRAILQQLRLTPDASALAAYQAHAASITGLRPVLAAQVRRLAQDAAMRQEIGTAVAFHRDLALLQQGDPEALKYLYRHRYAAGQAMTDTLGQTFVYIPPGTFEAGSPRDEVGRDSDEVQHAVTLTRGFFLGQREVTQREWRAIMGTLPRLRQQDVELLGDELPVHSVSWEQVQTFCRRLSGKTGRTYRLPTEAEWEYACRAGTTTAFALGGSLDATQAHVYDPSAPSAPIPRTVGRNGPANAWGLHDMHGNVWEWCQDLAAPYPGGARVDPSGPELLGQGRADLQTRILRGGSFNDTADKARSANRYESSPRATSADVGFRLVLEINPLE